MIQSRIKIGNGSIQKLYEDYKLIHMETDTRFEAPIKKRDVTSYVEEAGEHIDPRTVQDAFDYKITFIIEAPNYDLKNANVVIANFNKTLYEQDLDSGIRKYKEVTFYNDFKRIKIVGIPEPIQEAKEFYRRQNGTAMDCVQVEWNIRVNNPSKCNFNTNKNNRVETNLSLKTDGENIFVEIDKPIKTNQYVTILTRGTIRSRWDMRHGKSSNRWHVASVTTIPQTVRVVSSSGKKVLQRLRDSTYYGMNEWFDINQNYSKTCFYIRKASKNFGVGFPNKIGHSGKVCVGVALYEWDETNKRQRRVSNVAYFRKNAQVTDDGLREWLTV